MMAALLICGMSFAQPKIQRSHKEITGMVNNSSNERSGWIGTSASRYVIPMQEGQFVVFEPKVLDPSMSGTITKVKVGICNWSDEGFSGGQMRISLYPVPTLTSIGIDGYYNIPTLGTEIWGEDIDITSSVPTQVGYGDLVEVEFNTPATIPTGDFWIVITAQENICLLHSENGGVAGEFYYPFDATEYGYGWIFSDNATSTANVYVALTFQIFVDDGAVYQTTCDIEPAFYDVIPSPTGEISTLEIGETQDLVMYPIVGNNGPDVFPSTGTMDFSIVLEANGETFSIMEDSGALGFDLTTQNVVIFSNDYTVRVENDELMEMIGDATFFTVTLTATITSQNITEGDASNNSKTLLVTIAHFEPVQNLVATPNGSSVVLTWDAPEGAGSSLQGYLIYRDGTQIGMRPASQTTYTDDNVADGTYEYCVKARYGSGDSEEVCTETTVDGINEMAENIAIYPSPANSFVKIVNAEGARISVINSVGQVVATINEAAAEQEINVAGLANGIYTVRIANNNNVVTRQFSVSK